MKCTSLPLQRRREFITLLGGAVAWPLATHAQQPERIRRIGVLMPYAVNDAEAQSRLGAFLQALALLGWSIGGNVRIDIRWAGADIDAIRRQAAELVALAPDVILAHANAAVGALQQVTRPCRDIVADSKPGRPISIGMRA